MFRRTHLILGRDLDEQLSKTLQICGSYPLVKFVQKENFNITPKVQLFLNQFKKSEFKWEAMVDSSNTHTFDFDGLDLMKKLLRVNPEERISTKEALEHEFLS